GMINVAANISREIELLAPGSEPAHVPLRAGERALAILPLDANDREAVGLDFDLAAKDIANPDSGIDRRKRDRNLLLNVVDAETLERPGSDRNVGVGGNPLGVDEIAQAVVAGEVVAAGDGLVARPAERSGDAPFGTELELAI